jgi:hypothetical protein
LGLTGDTILLTESSVCKGAVTFWFNGVGDGLCDGGTDARIVGFERTGGKLVIVGIGIVVVVVVVAEGLLRIEGAAGANWEKVLAESAVVVLVVDIDVEVEVWLRELVSVGRPPGRGWMEFTIDVSGGNGIITTLSVCTRPTRTAKGTILNSLRIISRSRWRLAIYLLVDVEEVYRKPKFQ